MNKKAIITLLIGLVVGIVGTGGVSALINNINNKKTTTAEQATSTENNSMSMADMTKQLENLSGDEFNKAFIEMMIAHHKDAVTMASLIPSRSNRDELKKLGEAIVIAQTKEIADMQKWQMDWGYMSGDSSMSNMPGMNP